MTQDSEEPVPRLPRGKGMRLSGQGLFRIGMIAILLFAVVTLREPCADGIATLMDRFDAPDAGTATSDAGLATQPVIDLDPNLPPDELRKKIMDVMYPDGGSATDSAPASSGTGKTTSAPQPSGS